MKIKILKTISALLVCVVALSFSQDGYSQMGGMEMGPMGGPGMVPPAQPSYNEPLVVWKKPTGEMPQWLKSGQKSVESINRIRADLAEERSCQFVEETLENTLRILLEDTNISLELDLQSIADDTDTSVDQPITLTAKAPLRDILLRILKPLDLRYSVQDSYLLITSADAAFSSPVIRTFDLAQIMPDNANVRQLLETIVLSIAPDSWSENGGNNTLTVLGSLLIVRADEETHLELEKLLYNYSMFSANADAYKEGGMF
jgi:hypothetical protein